MVLYKWSKTKIGIQYAEGLIDSERILQFYEEAQERLISSPDFIKDKDYQNLTLMLDGVHIRLRGGRKNRSNSKEFRKSSWRSYKFKQKRAGSFQVIVDNMSMIKFVSLCFPSDWHDIHQARYCQGEMEDSVFNKDYDTMVMDTGYTVFHHDYGSSVAIIKKKSRGRSLTVAEKSRSFSLASVRSKIERVFGALKSKFKIISDTSHPFDGTK
jgi:hypothetical protein